MSRLIQASCMAVFLTILHFQGGAQELVMPPPGLTQERWELTYDDYRAPISADTSGLWMSDHDPDYPSLPPLETLVDLKRVVVMVRDGNDVYIQGIFETYPDAWIKGVTDGDRLVISNNQPIDAYGPIYFHMGSYNNQTGYGYLDFMTVTSYVSLTSGDDFIGFVISDNGDTIEVNSPNEFDKPSFWYDNDPIGDWVFDYNRHYHAEKADREGSGCPDIPYMINMVFRKIEDVGK